MNNIFKWSGVVALVLAIILIGFQFSGGKKFGNILDTSYFDYFQATTGFNLGSFTFLKLLGTNTEILLGNATNSLAETNTPGSCNSGTYAASSTQFAVLNPFSATSTVYVDYITVTGQATSTSLWMGTTTQATGATQTSVGASLLNNALLSTTTQAVYAPGQTTALGTGQVSPGSGTFSHITVGPSEYVALVATSTYSGAGNLNYTAGVGCTYNLRWIH